MYIVPKSETWTSVELDRPREDDDVEMSLQEACARVERLLALPSAIRVTDSADAAVQLRFQRRGLAVSRTSPRTDTLAAETPAWRRFA